MTANIYAYELTFILDTFAYWFMLASKFLKYVLKLYHRTSQVKEP